VIKKELYALPTVWVGDDDEDRCDAIQEVQEGHFACGWLGVLYVHSSHTTALELADDLLEKIEQYPALDEFDWSHRECEAAVTYWQGISIACRINWCKRYDVSIFAARRNEVPDDPRGELISALAR
jgi:hypothetical protein